MSLFSGLFSNDPRREVKRFHPFIERINVLEKDVAKLPDSAFQERTAVFKKELIEGKTLDDILPEAFALVREASKRTLGQRHFDVQLLGGVVLHNRGIAEMKTGEGKTLVATLPAYLGALAGRGVHIITVNDYLARRDAVWMGQIYDHLGLSVSVIGHDSSFRYDRLAEVMKDRERDTEGSFHIVNEFLRPCTRREAYEADITYGTNSEFGFDYLRDNIAYRSEDLVQRGHFYAIVDEVDSILIDEARTPLIISSPTGRGESLYPTFAKIARTLQKDEDYTIDEKQKAIQATERGIEKTEKSLGVENIYTDAGVKYVHHLETAIRAEALFIRDRDYVVKNGEVIIVDQFTGRMQPGRRWSEGLHQAIEAKEGVEIKQESRTYASITYQNYFRMYERLSGMTGTAVTSKEEFQKVYGLETFVVPTNLPTRREDQEDLIFQTEIGKFSAIAKKLKELNEAGRPVLVGTVSIEKNELLSALLKKEGVPHEILNAKNHEREGEIIAQAGKKGSVTIATNMAGRGVDIKLGGAIATEEFYEEVKAIGGLYVLGTERHEARRIDNQLRGRAGRQGDPGETQFFISLEDSLMRVFASDRIKSMMGRFGIPEDEPIVNKLVSRAIESAQEKIEGFNFDARKHVLEYDTVLNQQRQSIYKKRKTLLTGTKEELFTFLDGLIVGHDKEEEIKSVTEQKKKDLGIDLFWNIFRELGLRAVDMFWMEHLETMEYMRQSVNLRAYGQRDPLVEYKKEGLSLFKHLELSIKEQILAMIPRIVSGGETKHESKIINVAIPKSQKTDGSKVGRNDPCPCGSGKKFKYCHGK